MLVNMKWAELQERLQADKGNWVHIGRVSGVDPSQLSRYASGHALPGITNFERLAAYYSGHCNTVQPDPQDLSST
jgi:transcriptional regulator with XRE-family HTH domain